MDDEMDDHRVKDKNMLESAVETPFLMDYYGNDIFSKISYLWFKLAKNHPFTNGNKRTALVGSKYLFIDLIVDGALAFLNYQVSSSLKTLWTYDKKSYKKVKRKFPEISANAYKKRFNREKDRIKEIFIISNETKNSIMKELTTTILMPAWVETLNVDRDLTLFITSEVDQTNPVETEKAINHIKLNLVNLINSSINQINTTLNKEINNIVNKAQTHINNNRNWFLKK